MYFFIFYFKGEFGQIGNSERVSVKEFVKVKFLEKISTGKHNTIKKYGKLEILQSKIHQQEFSREVSIKSVVAFKNQSFAVSTNGEYILILILILIIFIFIFILIIFFFF